MSARVEPILLVGITQTRFDLRDDIKLRLKNGCEVSGTIIFMDESLVALESDSNTISVNVLDIEDYIDK